MDMAQNIERDSGGPIPPESRTELAKATIPGRLRANPKQAVASLYYTIASQRVLDQPVALQFVAAHPKAGTTVIASQFAVFAAQAQAGAALLIDCTVPSHGTLADGRARRPSLLDAYNADGRIDAALEPMDAVKSLYVARLTNNPDAVFQASTHQISAILDQARAKFQFVALDTPPLEEGAVTLTFSRISDGVVLVVEADRTKANHAEKTVEAIERSGGKMLGLVFNKRRTYMPRWLYRRL